MIYRRKGQTAIQLILFVSIAFLLTNAFPENVWASSSLPAVENTNCELVAPDKARSILNEIQTTATEIKISDESVGSAYATQTNNDIQNLARALKQDVDLIYEYVHNTIEYTPVFGSLKGAAGTLTDGRGNAFDQASLMISLLRESGYTANYIFGELRLTGDQITNWMDVANTSEAIGYFLGSSGIPAMIYVYGDGSVAYVDISHVWVSVNIEGTDFVFDPSYKTHQIIPGIDLSSAMGYNETTFLTNALSGTITGSDYLQNVNMTNISNDLATYASNLIAEIQTNHPGATLNEITGGLKIIPVTAPVRQSSLPYQQSITSTWSEIPANYRTTLRVQHTGIDTTLYSDEIYGSRLTLFYNTSNQAVLRLDGNVRATGNAVSLNTSQNITLTVDHPYAGRSGTYCDQSRTFSILSGGSYAIVNGWAETTRNMVEKHRKILNINRTSGGNDTDEPIMGETLAMMGYAWLAECHQTDMLMNKVQQTKTTHHHTLGVCGQNQSPYIDMPMSIVSVSGKNKDTVLSAAGFFSSSGRSSAFEWGMIEQFQPNSAVCTVKLIDLSNQQSDKIFDVTSANFAAVQSQLTGYSSGELANVQAYINAGYRLILPQNGDLGEGDWKGTGFLSISTDETNIGHIISGGFKGGFGDVAYTADPSETATTADPGVSASEHPQSDEPIDLVTGDYLYDRTDLVIGSGPYPFKMGFKRSYNSASRLSDGAMGKGWTHSFNIRAVKDNDAFIGLGDRTAIDAASAIVEIYISTEILKPSKSKDRLVIATLCHKWFMDQLIDNVVSIQIPGKTGRFLRLADGSYKAAPGDPNVLTKEEDNTFLMRTPNGHEFNFNTNGQLISWKDTNNNQITLSYNSGQLQNISNGMGRSFTLSYTGSRLTQVSDNTGRTVNYQYDTQGNLTHVTDVEGNDTVFQYDLPGRLTQIFYPANPSDPFVENAFGTDDKIRTQTDAGGNIWHYYVAGSRTEESNPLGNSTVLYFDFHGKTTRNIDALGNETTFLYDGENRITNKTLPEGNATSYTYDLKHNPLTVTFHPKPGSGLVPLSESYSYDPTYGSILSHTNRDGETTTFQYDGNNNLVRIEAPIVDSLTPVTQFTHNSRGQILTITDAEGRITKNTYDATTGELISTTSDDGGLNITQQSSYDVVGNRVSQTDPMGRTTTYEYNHMRQITRQTSPAPFNYITELSYDDNNQLTETRQETGDTLQPWQTTNVSYTLSGKQYTITSPEGNKTTYTYDSVDRLWKETNSENQTTEYIYDERGKILQVIDPALESAQTYSYTENGLKKSIQDANLNITEYQYDGFDRLDRTIYPDTTYESYTYNNEGKILTERTRAGKTISYSYDALNRLSVKTLPTSETIQHEYDLTGLLENITDNNGTIHYDYDKALRVTGTKYPDGKTIGYQYNDNGSRIRLIYPDNEYVTYSYDEMNRLTHVRKNGVTLLAQYSYDALSRRLTLNYGNGASTSYEYEIDNDLIGMAHQHSTGTVQISYLTNTIGMRTEKNIDDGRFLYQPSLSKNITHSVNNLNQYTEISAVTYNYDLNGNLTSDGANAYGYDSENRLTSATTPSHTVTYTYDPMGRRIQKIVNSEITKYLHDNNRVIIEYDGANQELRRYIYGPGIDEPICMITPAGTFYYQFDGLGTVIALSNSNGELAETYAYSPFGEPNGESTLGNPYRYTGREYEPETGLYFYRARYYDPAIGRFLQTDPIGYADGMNLYTYVLNNPVNYIDPLGLWTLGMDFSVTAGAGAGATAGYTFVMDSKFNFAVLRHSGAGGFGGVEAGGAAQIQITNAPTVNDLTGMSVSTGGSIGPKIIEGTAEWIVMPNGYQGLNFGAGSSVGPSPVELHSMVEYSDMVWSSK